MAALEDSRKSSHDGSGGTRRLGKLIDTCYPSAPKNGDEEEEQKGTGGVTGFFGRLMGRPARQSRDLNADTYDVVTPFFADEHGG